MNLCQPTTVYIDICMLRAPASARRPSKMPGEVAAAWAAQDAEVAQLLGEVDGCAARGLDRPADPAVLDDVQLLRLSDVELREEAKPARKRAKQPDWRRKYREEIARLRVEAAALAKTLETLRAAARSRLVDEESEGEQLPPSAASLWKKVADSQQECRQAAEVENGRLRGLVKQKQKEMRELRRVLLLKKANVQGICSFLGLSLGQHDCFEADPVDDARVFDALRGQMETLRLEFDAVFARTRIADMRCPDRTVQTRVSDSGQIVWEFVDAHAVPFDHATTAHAFWLTQGERGWQHQRGVDTQVYEVDANECMSRVRFRVAMPFLSINVLTRKVTRRLVEPNRVIFVSHSLHQPFFNGKLSSRAGVFREIDRTVIVRGAESQRTEIRRHILAMTGGEDMEMVPTEGEDWKATDRFSAGVHTWTWSISRDHDTLEDVLLQLSLGR